MRYSVTRTFSRAGGSLLFALGVLAAVGPVSAGERPYLTASDAYRQGMAAQAKNDAPRAVTALEFAARGGVLLAKLELARMFASGKGVEQSHAQAFYYYESIANDFADLDPRRRVAPRVAKAFVALGSYYRNGISEIYLSPNPEQAVRMFQHAASYFGDAEAQFQLATMYLAGEGVAKNVRLAANWLTSATRKHYAPAQAVLGDLLWRGNDIVGRQPAKGLALLALARLNAKQNPENRAWIEKLYEQAHKDAEPGQRKTAIDTAARWGGKKLTVSPAVVSSKEAAPPVAPAATKPGSDDQKKTSAKRPSEPAEQ